MDKLIISQAQHIPSELLRTPLKLRECSTKGMEVNQSRNVYGEFETMTIVPASKEGESESLFRE